MPAPTRNETAVVRPMAQATVTYKQSEHVLPKIPMRTMIVGRSAAGKGTPIASLIQEQYADCFEAAYVFASTVDVDPLWIALIKHIHEELGQPRDAYEMGSIPIAHSTIDEEAIRAILAKSEKSLKRQKQEG